MRKNLHFHVITVSFVTSGLGLRVRVCIGLGFVFVTSGLGLRVRVCIGLGFVYGFCTVA